MDEIPPGEYRLEKQKDKIIIRGARQHNLKNINLEIPRDKFVVITGLSGSGKSSLAFDTIYAEGQRRYIESLSAYARQFLGQMDKPDVDYIEGLSPAISIEQRSAAKNPRSTVATVTEIHDYLRLMFARIGVPHCPNCRKVIAKQTIEQMIDQILKLKEGTRMQVLAPLIKAQKGEHKEIFKNAKKQGYSRVRVDGRIHELEDEGIALEKNKKHTIEIVVDRLVVKPGIEKRMADSIQTALGLSKGTIVFDVNEDKTREIVLSEAMACPTCGFSLEELSPRMFSFNSPFGACKQCLGLGYLLNMDEDLVIPDKSKSVSDGAIVTMGDNDSWSMHYLETIARRFGFSLDTPINRMKKDNLRILLYGSNPDKEKRVWGSRDRGRWFRHGGTYHSGEWEGILPQLERRYNETDSEYMKEWYSRYMSNQRCPSCNGERFKPEILAVTINEKSISDLSRLSIANALKFMSSLTLTEKERIIASQILKEIIARLSFLMNVGLDYLSLDRAAATLSGGEAQRIQLATQIGSSLVGVLYILDEPSIGLHQRDNKKLIATLKTLRDIGNTVLVVEHDEETIRESDFVVDLGPGAGVHGGHVVATGTPREIEQNQNSVTGQYLSRHKALAIPDRRRTPTTRALVVKGARENNLKNIDVRFPLGVFVCITGVSGSGKSSLVNDILYRSLAQQLYESREKPGAHDKILGLENIDKAIIIDQSPIGRTPRSNPATYVGVFTDIRDLFAKLQDSMARGYKTGRFSFNVKGGRCEACEGDGIIRLEMHFLPDVYVPCEVCKGKRYNRETLEIRYKGKNVSEVLQMTVEEGLLFFENIPRIKRKLETLNDVGLGYVELGQPATTLSGGEAQRVKLATELSKRPTGKTLYLLDEPTTGLHFEDIKKLLSVLQKLTDTGNSVVVIEHNLDVIKTADWIIDLGPEGGDAGGRIVVEGTPEEVAMVHDSYTGQFLKQVLNTPIAHVKEARAEKEIARHITTRSSVNSSK